MSDPFSFLGNVTVNAGAVIGWASAAVTVASVFVASTKTPAPGSMWGKVYAGIEMAALVVGRAKELGIVPAPTKQQAAMVQTAETVAGALPTQPASTPT